MKRLVFFTPEAVAEFNSIAENYRAVRPKLEFKFSAAVDRVLKSILEFPMIGSKIIKNSSKGKTAAISVSYLLQTAP